MTEDVLDPSMNGRISYLGGRHACSLLHSGGDVTRTVYDDRVPMSSSQWWPLPRAHPTVSALLPVPAPLCLRQPAGHIHGLREVERRAQHAGQGGVEVTGGTVPPHDWLLPLQRPRRSACHALAYTPPRQAMECGKIRAWAAWKQVVRRLLERPLRPACTPATLPGS